MAMNELKEVLEECGNPGIEDVHNDLADVLKYFSDNYGETTLSGGATLVVKSEDMLQALNAMTAAVIWLKVNEANFNN